MPNDTSKTPAVITVAVVDGMVFIKIAGRATFACSVDVKKLVVELSQRGHQRFIFDLSECIMMDSTFLGVLAGIGLKFAEQKVTPPNGVTLLHPNARIADLLENLGVAHLFCDANPPPASPETLEQLPGGGASKQEVTRTCLEAHQLLMRINPENQVRFKDVATFMADELKAMENQG